MAKIISFTLLLFFCSLNVNSAPHSDLWAFWDDFDELSEQVVPHHIWRDFLATYADHVDSKNATRLISYSSVTDGDKNSLKKYIRLLSGIDPRALNRNEQFAYWINLYNALTIDLILDNYPVTSITKLGGFFSFGPWDEKIISVVGKQITLNDIEHRILRPIWNDKRIHYVVNCASIGCPNLMGRPFDPAAINAQLDSAAAEFINSKKGAHFDGKELVISKIYEWYAADFGDIEALKAHLLSYRVGGDTDKLKHFEGKINYRYDWRLNDRMP